MATGAPGCDWIAASATAAKQSGAAACGGGASAAVLVSGGVDSRAPLTVVRGAKSSVTTGVDWLRVIGSRSKLEEAGALIRDEVGEVPGVDGSGRWFFKYGRTFENGMLALWSDPDERNPEGRCCWDVPGSVLAELSGPAVWRLIYGLGSLGMRCARLDVCVDFRAATSERLELVEGVYAACEAGELTGARTFSQVLESGSGVKVGHTVYLGKRGSYGSGRCVRVYDKGLERGQGEGPGRWQRWETEFCQDVAGELWGQVLGAMRGADDWEEAHTLAVRAALGAVDFLQVTGRRELALRPRVVWWGVLLAGVDPLRVRAVREKTTLSTWSEWVRSCVAPSLWAMSRASGLPVGEVLAWLMGDEVDWGRKLGAAVVQEFVSESAGGARLREWIAERKGVA